ncbi:hypothetical protein ERN12_13140 [Rhodobacteraceae bacterium]|nr:hypothetical protein ERN12_13140 [Paracoccaceae bacterium]
MMAKPYVISPRTISTRASFNLADILGRPEMGVFTDMALILVFFSYVLHCPNFLSAFETSGWPMQPHHRTDRDPRGGLLIAGTLDIYIDAMMPALKMTTAITCGLSFWSGFARPSRSATRAGTVNGLLVTRS